MKSPQAAQTVLHGDLLSGQCGRPGPRFLDAEATGTKKPSLPLGKETKAGRHGAEETPLPSCPWRDSCPGHEARDLMSAEKQVF